MKGMPAEQGIKALTGLATNTELYDILFECKLYFPVHDQVSSLGVKAIFTKWCV